MADESASSEKFVFGTTNPTSWSWTTVKSSMQFCRSPRFLKKSLLNSLAGFTVLAGASGGPRGR